MTGVEDALITIHENGVLEVDKEWEIVDQGILSEDVIDTNVDVTPEDAIYEPTLNQVQKFIIVETVEIVRSVEYRRKT